MDRRERLNDPVVAALAAQDGLRARIWTALPGVVRSFDPEKNTCVVQPTIQAQVRNQAGQLNWVNMPQLLDCPVVFPSGGGFSLTFPLAADDEVLVIFAARCIDNWWDKGGVQQQAELRMHDLSDGFVLPGPFSKAKVPASISSSAVQLRSKDGATVIQIDGQQNINLTASGDLTGKASGSVSLSAGGSFSAGGSTANLSGKAVNVSGFVSLGVGGAALNSLSGNQETAFQNYIGDGNASILSNPIASPINGLQGDLTSGGSVDTGLAGLVTGGSITPTDYTNLTTALGISGGGGLNLTASNLLTHANYISGLLTNPTDPTVPFLQGIIGVAGGLDNLAGGRFGTAAQILPAITTAITSSPAIAAATTYVNSIVPILTADPTQVPAVLTAIGDHSATLGAYITNDVNAYASAKASISTAQGFLRLVSDAKNPNGATQTLLGNFATQASLDVLRSIGQSEA